MTINDDVSAANRRIWRRTSWITGSGAVAGGLVGAVFFHQHGALAILSWIVALGGLAGAFSMFPTQLGRSGDLSIPLLGVHPDRRRAIRRNVLRRPSKPRPPLSADERHRARQYAHAYRSNQPLNTVQGCLFFVGLLGSQLNNLGGTDTTLGWLLLANLTVVPAVYLATSIWVVILVRRATAYIHESQQGPTDALPTSSPPRDSDGAVDN